MTLAFSTGLDSFSPPEEIGPMFPFDGLTVLFFVIGLALWLGWHAMQIRAESRKMEEERETYEEIGLDRAMFHGASAMLPSEEEWEEAQRRRGAPPPGGAAPGGPERGRPPAGQ